MPAKAAGFAKQSAGLRRVRWQLDEDADLAAIDDIGRRTRREGGGQMAEACKALADQSVFRIKVLAGAVEYAEESLELVAEVKRNFPDGLAQRPVVCRKFYWADPRL